MRPQAIPTPIESGRPAEAVADTQTRVARRLSCWRQTRWRAGHRVIADHRARPVRRSPMRIRLLRRKRALQPAPHRRDQRRRAAVARACEFIEQRVDSPWILARSDSPAQQQGQRDERELKNICLLVEPREAVPVAGDGEPEVLQSPDRESAVDQAQRRGRARRRRVGRSVRGSRGRA